MKALLHQNGLSICVSINLRSASEIIRKCVQVAEAVKLLSKGAITYTSSFDKVVFSTGQRVISLPAGNDGSAGRGWTLNGGVLCLDEAGYLRNLDDLLTSFGPTLTTSPDSELVLTSTPSGKNHPFYRLWEQAQTDNTWFASHIPITTAIEQGMKVDLEQLHKICPDPAAFSVEYMAEFAAVSSEFVDLNIVDFVDTIPELQAKWLGVDVGSSHDRTAFATVGLSNGEYYVTDIEKLKGAEYTHQQARTQALQKEHRYTHGYIDANGIGAALSEFIHKSPGCATIEGFVTTPTNKPKLFETLRSKIFERKIHFASKLREQILAEFSKISKISNADGKTSYLAERDSEGHCDGTSALILALESARTHPLNATSPSPAPFPSAFGSKQWRFRR